MADIMRERKAIHSPRQVNLGEDHTYAGFAVKKDNGLFRCLSPLPLSFVHLRTSNANNQSRATRSKPCCRCAVVPLFIAGFAWRLLDEEKLLRASLPGYAAYMRNVRYRLIPHVKVRPGPPEPATSRVAGVHHLTPSPPPNAAIIIPSKIPKSVIRNVLRRVQASSHDRSLIDGGLNYFC